MIAVIAASIGTPLALPQGGRRENSTHERDQSEVSSFAPAAVVVFILATLGVAPVPMTPLGLALWCGSTLVP
jgi:hypothetical protein